MAFRFTKDIASGYPIPHDVKSYICTSEDDIQNLPRVGILGKSDHDISNAPCWYGSEAVIADGTSTKVYVLNADNVWTKM